MTNEEALSKLKEEEKICKYCRYSDDCSGGVTGGPNGPIYPPCCDSDDYEFIDVEAYIESLEEEND